MKKFFLLISLLLPLLFSHVPISGKIVKEISNENCNTSEEVAVRIINNYNAFVGNGFIYKSENNYSYVVTSSKLISGVNSYKIIYKDNTFKDAVLLGTDLYNEVAVLKTSKMDNIDGVCTMNSHYLRKGQKGYLYGYFDKSNDFKTITYINSIGEVAYTDEYINIYKTVIDINGNNNINGVGVYDELNQLLGMVTGYQSKLLVSGFMVDSNKLIKIADSIVKTGNYKINYIKYSLVDYGFLSESLRKNYGVSSKASSGVVITTFKPLHFVFGGLNQGMVIVAVNGVTVNSKYELDKQISRYEKKSKVCLKVIKKNGKVANYYVKV